MISAQGYADAVRPVLDRLLDSEADGITRAADLIADSLRAGGVLQAFGAGHSEAFAGELVARAGGLVPTNRLSVRDLVLHGDAPRGVLADPKLERDPSIAHQIYALAAPQPRTCSWWRPSPASTARWSSWRRWSPSVVTR
ncbi:hypothetical protein GCM10027614_22690 [Micromonospora vulcania]